MRVFTEIGTRLSRHWDLDGVQMAALARVQRRPSYVGAAAASADVPSRSRWLTVTPYLEFAQFFIPGLVGVAGILFPSFFLGLAFSYTLIMVMFGLPFLNHCTAVLLDTSENRILLHLPISGRTLIAARLLNIVKHAGFLIFAIGLPTAIALAVRFGTVALPVFVISLILTLILVVAMSLAVCLFALRHVDPARIREGILWFQTVFFILAIGVAGLVLTDASFVQRVPHVSGQAWWYFYPPGWMAGLLDYALVGKTPFNGVLAVTAVVAPLAGFIGCIQLFAGARFTALLSHLEVPRSSEVTPRRFQGWLTRLSERISVFVNRDQQERAVFDLTSKLMKSDSVLKWQVFPYIGTTLLYCGVCVVKYGHVPMPGPALFIYCYMPMSVAISVRLIQYSQNGPEWRAAWCYEVLPFAGPGVIVSGAMKAYICKYVMPIYLLLLVVGAAFWGTAVALNVLFAIAAIILACMHCFWGAAPPYSKDPVLMPQTFGLASNFLFVPLVLGLIVIHIVLKSVAGDWGVMGGVVVLGGVITVAYRKFRFPRSSAIHQGAQVAA